MRELDQNTTLNQSSEAAASSNETKGEEKKLQCLLALGTDPLQAVCVPFLSNKDLASAACACLLFNNIFQPALLVRRLNKLNKLVKKVAWGQEEKAKVMLEKYPALLLGKGGIAPDVFLREGMDIASDLTPFQVALCAGDVEMCEMMKTYFEMLPKNGQEEMQKQFAEIFPQDIEVHVEEQQQNAFKLTEIFNAIIHATDQEVKDALDKKNNDSPLSQALNYFRDEFMQKSLSEKIFNPYHLLNAFEAYVNQINAYQIFKYKRYLLIAFFCELLSIPTKVVFLWF